MRASAATTSPAQVAAVVGRPAEERTSLLQGLAADPGLVVAIVVAVVLSVASAAYFLHADLTTALVDSRSRLLIARTVVDGRHSGLAQLGGIWPPFPQLYMLPFVWSDLLYYSGIAGVIPSAACYVASSAFLYKLVSRLTRDQAAGVVAVVAFSGPNILYLQSTPMSELPFIACFLGVTYFAVSWMLKGSLLPLFLAGLLACLGTLTRYEGWVLAVLLTTAVVAFSWRAGHEREEIEGLVLLMGLMAFLGIGLWMLWNRVIFGDALYFLHSQYGTKAINGLQLSALPPAARPKGNLPLSVEVVGWAVLDNAGPLVVVMAILGLFRLALAVRFRPATITAALLLIFPIPFSIAAAYAGAEVIRDPNATPGGLPINIRYGLLGAPAVGFFAGWLAQGPWQRWVVLGACVASSLLVWQAGLVNLEDASTVMTAQGRAGAREGQWLHDHYDGGLILLQRRDNEDLLFLSRVPLDRVVYEGDRDEWTAALQDPLHEIRWIVMNGGDQTAGGPPDAVWAGLHDSPLLLGNYQLVYQDGPLQVYRR